MMIIFTIYTLTLRIFRDLEVVIILIRLIASLESIFRVQVTFYYPF